MMKIQMIFNELRTVHTLSSDLPLMIFFSYLPNRRFPVFILVVKQFPNLKFSPNVLHFETFRVILFVFFLTHAWFIAKKLLLIPLIAMKSGNALDLPLSGISLNTSIVLNCMI